MNRQVAMFCAMVIIACVSTAGATVLSVGPTQTYTTVQAAVNAASNGDTIEIDSGTYYGNGCCALITQDNLTLRGVGATRPILDADGEDIAGKAIWVIQGENTTVEFVEFRNCTVASKNGAGIRQEGDDLTVTDCCFRDNEDGILTGASTTSSILIEYTEFDNNGWGDGQSHNMYIGTIGDFTLRHCYSHNAYVGHELKSRAYVNTIEYNRITNEDGNGSRNIDIPNGGTTYVIGNLLHQSVDTSNSNMLAYAGEGATNPDQHLYIVNNTFVSDRNITIFLYNYSTTDALVQNNIFQASGTVTLLTGPGTQTDNWSTTNAYLANESTYDYALTSSSTGAINSGSAPGYGSGYSLTPIYQYVHPLDYESRPTDATIDIGAYEYGSGTGNQAPSVDAGDNDSITLPTNSVSLDGTVTDDGLPDPPAAFTTLWTKLSGPGTVTFGDDEDIDTTASFSAAGVYVLKLEADDSVLTASDTVTITVNSGGSAPDPATNPSPANGATKVAYANVTLSWTAGDGATSHDVYFGRTSSPGSAEFMGNQTGTTFNVGTLGRRMNYYWRIDEVNAYGTTTGTVWGFKTASN